MSSAPEAPRPGQRVSRCSCRGACGAVGASSRRGGTRRGLSGPRQGAQMSVRVGWSASLPPARILLASPDTCSYMQGRERARPHAHTHWTGCLTVHSACGAASGAASRWRGAPPFSAARQGGLGSVFAFRPEQPAPGWQHFVREASTLYVRPALCARGPVRGRSPGEAGERRRGRGAGAGRGSAAGGARRTSLYASLWASFEPRSA